ncbi:ferredoxin [Prauserella marina]|uniref:Vanillate O-demethylase ferredoxin subunit n=1 Tax=Prauserella marina TaxID=530584 RepID=A0A222VPY4_9PSEU|nr:PDR/VanB family oxidoreductase [Prauserella marina]ASR35970.1 ferredoxin [Prauserella marina]PWV84091.1 vanillate O-demethylase ferredoxin subunit [Prauserella marina]SDC30542.1 vanillate O-demethylase ferredoxin subunit [Prauserella marina]
MRTVKVTEIVVEAEDVRTYRLAPADGGPVEPFEPGAHIDVVAPRGGTRQYSLCGAPGEDSQLIAVKRERPSRGGSESLHEQVAVGDELVVSAPRNLFAIAAEASRHVLLAAGIGITPLLAMAHRLLADGADFTLHYFASSAERAAFTGTLGAPEFEGNARFHFGVDRETQLAILGTALSPVESGLDGTHVYACGPKGFLARVGELAGERAIADRLHVEHFQPLEPAERTGDEFELELDTGEVFPVAAGQSIVDVLEDNGYDIETSCREGICGTCVLDVLEGSPEHRDNCLSRKEKEAGDRIAACVSRSRTPRLVVEL